MTSDLHGLPWGQRRVGLRKNSISRRLELRDLLRIALGFGTGLEGVNLLFDLNDRIFKIKCHHRRYKSPVLRRFYREAFGFVESVVDAIGTIDEPEKMNSEHNSKKLGFLGCGNMGGAILEGLLAHGAMLPDDVLVVEKSSERAEFWRKKGVSVSQSPDRLDGTPTILLGVKPQIFDQVADSLGPLKSPCMVISVMAGIDSGRIAARLGSKARIVRVMPNTPCMIGMGISAIARGHHSSDDDMRTARGIMSTVGRVIEVDESKMHAVTATSGSGPAYLFLMAESWIEASIATGLSREQAEVLVIETIRGSGELLHRERDAAELRAKVTSKGGTTFAGIESLEGSGLRDAMIRALKAAHQRGIELGSEISS